jgi:riboflavin synthase
MFTGIVLDVGRIEALERRDEDMRLAVVTARLDLSAAHVGDSIAIGGVCLTAVELRPHRFCADVSLETLARTTLGTAAVGQRVNLEPALRAGDPLGGHLVAGHVDGVGQLLARRGDARSEHMRFRVPHELSRYLAPKGSICLDGVSLTINLVHEDEFEVNLVPHTLTVTTLGELAVGDRVNLEVDLIARYLERLMLESGRHP